MKKIISSITAIGVIFLLLHCKSTNTQKEAERIIAPPYTLSETTTTITSETKGKKKLSTEYPASSTMTLDAPKSDVRLMKDATTTGEVVEKIEIKEAFDKANDNISAGTLTAGEINDFSKWTLWQDISEGELKQWQNNWQINPSNRYTVQLVNMTNYPIVNAEVSLINNKQEVLWTAITDNTGKAELWASMFINEEQSNSKSQIQHSLYVDYNEQQFTIANPSTFENGINTLAIDVACTTIDNLDIQFVVDATGSMGDEIEYLKVELNNIIEQIKQNNEQLNIRLGSVFYRDTRDEYLTKQTPFSTNIKQTIDFIKGQSAGGGGDNPEAVDAALAVAINEMEWSRDALARIIFLVLDAPPHQHKLKEIQALTKQAAIQGIRIVPVVASGIDKSTEYLMRTMALATNGTYVFLTDDSGVGNPHLIPTTDEYEVEKLNVLLIRLINQYVQTTACKNDNLLTALGKKNIEGTKEQPTNSATNINSELTIPLISKFYPNPTHGPLTIETEQELPEFYIADVSGKILERWLANDSHKIQINLANYPNGIYFLRYLIDANKDKWYSGKVILIH